MPADISAAPQPGQELREALEQIARHDNYGLTDGSVATRCCLDWMVTLACDALSAPPREEEVEERQAKALTLSITDSIVNRLTEAYDDEADRVECAHCSPHCLEVALRAVAPSPPKDAGALREREYLIKLLRMEGVYGKQGRSIADRLLKLSALPQPAADRVREAKDEVIRWARALVMEPGGLRMTPSGTYIVEKADKSDPHYQLCKALGALSDLGVNNDV